MENWFDSKTGLFKLDELVSERETFKKIMADGYVSSEELETQSNLVLEKLKNLDKNLSSADKQMVGEVLAELAVLFSVTYFQKI